MKSSWKRIHIQMVPIYRKNKKTKWRKCKAYERGFPKVYHTISDSFKGKSFTLLKAGELNIPCRGKKWLIKKIYEC